MMVGVEDAGPFVQRLLDRLVRIRLRDAEEIVVRRPIQAPVGVPHDLALELVLLGDARGRLRARDLDVQEQEAFCDSALFDGPPLGHEPHEARGREPRDDALVAVDLLHGRGPVHLAEHFRFLGRDRDRLIAEQEIGREHRPRPRIERRVELGRGRGQAAQGLEEHSPGRTVHLRGHVGRRVEGGHREDVRSSI